MNALTDTIAEPLQTFVKPQIDQLSINMEPIHCGMFGNVRKELGEGYLWTASLGENCLISVHSIKLSSTIVLEEEPDDFSCIFSGSRATVLSSPELKIPAPLERENLALFAQDGGTSKCILEAGSLYESTSITLTPDFLDQLKDTYSDDLRCVLEQMESYKPTIPPQEVRDILRSFNPDRAQLPGASLYFRAKVLEAIGFLSAQGNAALPVVESGQPSQQSHHNRDYLPLRTTNTNDLSRSSTKAHEHNLIAHAYNRAQDNLLIMQAQAYIAEHLSSHMTIESIAANIYTSRSHLCKTFKEVLGMGVAEYIRKVRIKTACQLLQSNRYSISEVSNRVGYARASAFSEAFRQTTGISPSQYRQAVFEKTRR